MSHHDLTIDNDAGADVRADVQAALQALGSTSLGNSAPATIYQGQQWTDSNTPSASIWTVFMYDGATSIGLWYVDTATNVAYPVSAMPLLGFAAQGSPVMTGDIRTTAATAVPGSGNATAGYNLSSNGSLHLNNAGSYTLLVGKTAGSGTAVVFTVAGTTVGSISVTGSATAYNTSSDHRLKTNVEPIDWRDAALLIERMNPVWFNWISQPLGNRVDGFIAHELAEVLPGAVTGEKDAVDGKGNIIPQGVDQAKLTPLLVATVKGLIGEVREIGDIRDAGTTLLGEQQEEIRRLVALVDTLTARIEALEAKGA